MHEGVSNDSHIELVSNLVLEDIVAGFENTPPNWRALVIEEFKRVDPYRRRTFNRDQLPGLLAEAYFRHYLKNWARYTNLVALDPIPNNTVTQHFGFIREPFGGNYRVTKRSGGNYIAKYDVIMTAANLPTLIELKTNAKESAGSRGSGHTGKKVAIEVKNLLRPEYYYPRLAPLQEYFGSNELGYVVIVPSDSISDASLLLNQFKTAGGIIGRFYTTAKNIRSEVESVAREFHL